MPDPAGDPSPVPGERGTEEAGKADTGLPEAAVRRMTEHAFTSGLSVPDFAACLQMGLRPAGFVQGSSVMQWQWYGYSGAGSPFSPVGQWTAATPRSGGYQRQYPCPHGFVSAEHRLWGQNLEQTWIEDAWRSGYLAAFGRMVDETMDLGADGIVGVVDSWHPLTDMGVLEFHVFGTAVRRGEPDGPDGPGAGRGHRDRGPWSTYLAGQRLAKLLEAGYAPVSVVADVSDVRVWASCVTQYLAAGSVGAWGVRTTSDEITQVSEAQTAVRQLAREHVRAQLGPDSLNGASMQTTVREVGEGDADLQCVLRGNRVRRFRDFEPLPRPRPTVRLR